MGSCREGPAMSIQHYSTGNPWERAVGFSRALRVGDLVYTAGTIASDQEGNIQGQTCYEQAVYILRKLEGVLEEAGSSLTRVIKCVAYLTRIEDEPDFTRAHCELLGPARPVTTCVVVQRLFGEGSLVELELTALATESPGNRSAALR